MPTPLSRRALLRASAPALAAALAGCSLTDEESTDTPRQTSVPTEETTTLSTTTTSNPTPTTEQCQSGPVEPTVSEGAVDIFHPWGDPGATLYEESATIFADTYDVPVTTEGWTGTHYDLRLHDMIPQADGPELFGWRHTSVTWVFDDYVADQGDELRVDPCQYTDPAWNAAQYRGQTIGLPVAAETVALYYNEAIVDEPPETLAEMQAVMADHHDPDNDQYGLGINIHPFPLSGFAQAYGGEMYDGEADELGLTSDAVERGFRVFFEELAEYAVESGASRWNVGEFENGDVAFAIGGPWRLKFLPDTDIEWGVTTLPELPDGRVMRPYTGVELLYFSKRVAEDPTDGRAARQFAEWYTTNESRLRTLANEAQFVPVYSELVGDSTLADPMRVFSEQSEHGYAIPANPKMDDVWRPLGERLHSVYEGEMELAEALTTAEEQIRERWAEDT